MQDFRDVLEQFDSLWQRSESLVEACLEQLHAADPPDLKALNTVVTVLKRIQDARRAIQLDAMKLEANGRDANRRSDALDDQAISRILQHLESNGDRADADGADEEPL